MDKLKSLIQPLAIDIADWQLDDLYFNYPEGARSKNAIFPPSDLDLDFIIPLRRYLYKRSVQRYPDQFWAEIVAYQVGCNLGVVVPPAFAAFNSETGTCGALIEWFYEDGKAELVSGGNFMQILNPEYDRKKGKQHNFEWISIIGDSFESHAEIGGDWRLYWSRAILFDSLIGNTDRHQDNWGYLFLQPTNEKEKVDLSPLFDNGTSLGHERFPALIENWQNVEYDRYISKGTHHMRWKKDDPKPMGHIESIRLIMQQFPDVVPYLTTMVNEFSIDAIANGLEHLKTLQLSVPLTNERADLYLKLISLRKQKIELVLS